MNTYLYLLFVLFVLSSVGMAVAIQQDLKPSTKPTNLRWVKWIVLMALLALIDTTLIITA